MSEELKPKAAHDIWAHWMRYYLANRDKFTDADYARWERQSKTEYKDLLPKEQKSDIEIASLYLTTIEDSLRSENERLRAMMQWQDISTAPRDGTIIDVWLGNASKEDLSFYCMGKDRRSCNWFYKAGRFRPYLKGDGILTCFVKPTHWMPLPPAPQIERE